MERKRVSIFYGDGKGKTTAALGKAVRLAGESKTVVFIQFFKGREIADNGFMKRLEPEIKCFSFEKSEKFFDELTDEEKKDEIVNMQNGMNFAKKVLTTREADVLVLDEVLGLLDSNMIQMEAIHNLIEVMSESTEMILTGRSCSEELMELCTEVSQIEKKK